MSAGCISTASSLEEGKPLSALFMPCERRVGGPGKTADSGHSISEAVQSIEAEPFNAFAWSASGVYPREDSQSRIMNLTVSCLETIGATPLTMNAPTRRKGRRRCEPSPAFPRSSSPLSHVCSTIPGFTDSEGLRASPGVTCFRQGLRDNGNNIRTTSVRCR